MTEIILKSWVISEANRLGFRPMTIYKDLTKRYPGIQLRRLSKRTIFVKLPAPARVTVHKQPPPGAIPIKCWLMEESERTGLKTHTIWTRLDRGWYHHVERIYNGRKRADFLIITNHLKDSLEKQ